MIIWKGYGILVAIVGILSAILVGLAFDAYAYEWSHAHPKITEFSIFFVAAIMLYLLAILLKKSDKPKVVIDKETGREIHLRRGDSLFFIPVIAWPFIVAAFSIFKLFTAK